MKNKCIIILFFFLCFKSYSANTIYEIGPKTENIIVFTASRDFNNEEVFSTKILEDFAKDLDSENLKIRVLIAITDNDVPNLPDDIDVSEHRNTKKIISKINESKSSLVFMLSDGPSDKVILNPGAAKKTSPSWMLKDLHNSLQKQNIDFGFKYNNIILYRLGIIDEDILGEYLKKNIPAIKISTSMDIRPVLRSLINIYSNGISSEWDKHYNINSIFGFRIISEKIIVILILFVTLAALFYIFIFSFLFGKKRETNIRDLLKLWRVPIFFFIINLFALYIGEYITLRIFSLKFGFDSSINFLPIIALLLKFSSAALISSLFLYISRSLKLPNNTFIYGYLASIACFLNIFIFSKINLSLAVILLCVYILSFIAYHFQRLSSQIIFFILNIVLLVYFFFDILFVKDNIISVLFYSNNILGAVFILPYSLMFIRFFMRLKSYSSHIKSMSVIITGITGFFSVICISLILIYPSFLHSFDKAEFALYNVEDERRYISIFSNVKNKFETIEADKEVPELFSIKVDDFIKVQTRSENYLERIIGEINVMPLIRSAVIKIIVSRDDGFPIYEANTDFKKLNEGRSAEFVTPINLTDSFSIKFSSEKNAVLHIKILAWFYDNPLSPNLKVSNENLSNKKLIFQVTKEFDLFPILEQ